VENRESDAKTNPSKWSKRREIYDRTNVQPPERECKELNTTFIKAGYKRSWPSLRASANNGDFIVRFNLHAPLSTWPCPVPQLRRRRRRQEQEKKEEEEEEEEKDACEPCTYVSVNDEDYRSFLAAGEKLKASSLWAPFSPFHVQWRRKTFVERTSEPTTLRGFIIPFRFSLLPTLRTKEEFEHVHTNTVHGIHACAGGVWHGRRIVTRLLKRHNCEKEDGNL